MDQAADFPYSLTEEARIAGRNSLLLEVFQRMGRAGPHTALAAGRPPIPPSALERWQECIDAVLARDGAAALQYQVPLAPLCEWLAERMRSRGVACAAEQIFITAGNQQGLQLAARVLLNPGQRALMERPAYSGFIDISNQRGAELVCAALRPGMALDRDAWQAACLQDERPALAFTVSDFHNPTGGCYDAEARAWLAKTAAATGVPLVEDDAYSELRIAGENLPPIRAYPGGEAVLYLGTLSKTLFPALRLGWMVAPPALFPALTGLRESIDLQSSALMALTAYEFLRRGWLDEHLARLRHTLRERLAALQEGLQAAFGADAEWEEPQGGLFLWLRLPPEVDSAARFEETISRGVSYVPGAAFYDDGGGANTVRLNFAGAPAAELRAAAFTLAETLLPKRRVL